MSRFHSSQELWTEAEALERAGKAREAIGLYAKAAVAEEDDGEPTRARVLWERVAERTGATGTLLERLALCCEKAKLRDDAYSFWLAAAARYDAEKRPDDLARARSRAVNAKPRHPGSGPRPALAEGVLSGRPAAVADLL